MLLAVPNFSEGRDWATLEAIGGLGILRSDWLAEFAAGTAALDPASAAMLVNLEVAVAATGAGQ